MLSSPASARSRRFPGAGGREEAGQYRDSTNTFPRKHPLSSFELPFTDAAVGIHTICLMNRDRYPLDRPAHGPICSSPSRAGFEAHGYQSGRKADHLGRRCDHRETHVMLGRLWRGFIGRLGKEPSRRHAARGKLRPEREMDNFSCSHRCLQPRRLWSGARSVFQHRRVPLRHFVRFIRLLRPPLPQ